MSSQDPYTVKTIISPKDTGYIHEDDLLKFLNDKFPAYKYSNFSCLEKDRFHIEHRDEQFTFSAPASIDRSEYRMTAQLTERWRSYPVSLDDYKALVVDGGACLTRLDTSPDLFMDRSNILLLESGSFLPGAQTSLETDQDLQERLFDIPPPTIRIISIHQNFSFSPLNISNEWMRKILFHFQVDSNFLHVLFKFGDKPQTFQEHSGFRSIAKSHTGAHSICYDFMYIEQNGRKPPKAEFSERRAGVFHRYDPKSRSSFAILLHANVRSKAQTRLKESFEIPPSTRESAFFNPLEIHQVILSSYLGNWQEYMESLGGQLMELRQKILFSDINTAQPQLHPEAISTLRHLEDKIFFGTSGGLKGALSTINILLEFNDRLSNDGCIAIHDYENTRNDLRIYLEQINGYIVSVEAMEKRIAATIDSLSSLLQLRNQALNLRNQETAEINNQKAAEMNNLIEERNELFSRLFLRDNSTFKILAVIGSLYLPASFVTSFFGMNFFDFQENAHNIQMSSQIWIFVVAAVLLTAMTALVVFLWWHHQKRIYKHQSGSIWLQLKPKPFCTP